jgi:uncharacterized protein YjbI with pentapeptide repeats
MADPEHLAKLNEGIHKWNRWRHDNPEIKPDLQEAELSARDLAGFDLSEVTLSRARLRSAYMVGADLRRAHLSGVHLKFAQLRDANLSQASLTNAVLTGADLSNAIMRRANCSGTQFYDAEMGNADLTEAYLSGTVLSNANLANACLRLADLSDARLRQTNLRDTNLESATLAGADLVGAKLDRANLRSATVLNASLRGVSLTDANLSEADFKSANLKLANLAGSNLDRVDFSSANLQRATLDECFATRIKLWETQRAGWSIKGIRCDSAYWDKDALVPTTYIPGEFERLYADVTCIEFFYQGGVSTFELSTLPAILHHLAELHEGVNIRLKSIEETGGGAKISISVSETDLETTEKIKADAIRVFQSQLALRDNQIVRLQIEKEYLESFVSEKLIHHMLAAATPQNTFNAPVYNAAFASGSSRVSVNLGVQDNAALLSLLETILAHRGDLSLPPRQAERLDTQLELATTELIKPSPDVSLVAKGVQLIKELATEGLKKAAGKLGEQAISADWHTWMTQLHDFSSHLRL